MEHYCKINMNDMHKLATDGRIHIILYNIFIIYSQYMLRNNYIYDINWLLTNMSRSRFLLL